MYYKELYIPATIHGHNPLIVTTGVSASGKDYILRQLSRSDQRLNSTVQVVGFSSYLFNYLKQQYNITSRDGLANLLTQSQIAPAVAYIIDRVLSLGPTILNTHVVYKQNGQLTTNPDIDNRLNPQSYVYVWTDPDQILERRRNDHLRAREIESIDEIAKHQTVALETTFRLALRLGSRMRTIYNTENDAMNATSVLSQEIDELKL